MLIKKFTDVTQSVEQYRDILLEAKAGMDENAARRFFVRSVRQSNDLTFDNQGNVVPSMAGWKLIDGMDKAHPERDILHRYMNALTTPGNPLMDWALAEQFNVIRTGFTERGLHAGDAQTNGEHVNNMLRMSNDTLVSAKIVIHDIAEVATTDFSKPFVEENNLANTKDRLEKIAAAILMQREPALYQLWMEYEDKATWRDRVVKEFDNLEHLIYVGHALKEGLPHYMHDSFIEAVRDTVEKRMQSPHFEMLARSASMTSHGGFPLLPPPDLDGQ